ncbi:MAG TPA: DUF6256 family protein [Streptosporangiaceae bacterium]|nr:DUF6256 family protein [Streptosporangiaceae bacterium]
MAPDGILALTTADRQALIPMSAGYLILITALGFGLRRLYRPRGAPSGAEPSPGQGEQPGQAPPAPPGQGEQPEQAPATPPGRAPASPPGPGQRTGRAALARQIASTVIGGYLLLMAVIVAYYFGVARVGPGFLESALTGTALLLALAAPVFVALSWLAERRGRS